MTSPSGASLIPNQNDLQSGEHLIDGGTISAMLQWTLSASAPLTALAGGGASGAPVMSNRITVAGVVASANDSFQLPFGVAGMILSIINLTTTAAKIWPNAGLNPQTGIADSLISATGVPVTVGSTLATEANISFYCYASGLWKATV